MSHTIICGSIIRNEDSVLLVQESKDRAYGEWNLPTGKIESEESPEKCATREALEEAGIHIEPKEVVGVYSKPGEKTDIVLAVIFYSETEEYELDPDEDEVLDAEWVPLEEIEQRDLRSSHILPAINDHQSGDLYSTEILTSLQTK